MPAHRPPHRPSEKIVAVAEDRPGVAEALKAMPGRSKAVLAGVVVAVAGIAVAGIATSTWPLVFASAAVVVAAGAVVGVISGSGAGQKVAVGADVMIATAAGASLVVGPVGWGIAAAAVGVAAVGVVEIVRRNFAPSTVRLDPALRVRLASMQNYDVIELPVPGGAEALAIEGLGLFLVGSMPGTDPDNSTEFAAFKARRAQLVPILERSGLDCGAIVITVDDANYGPRTVDDVVVCGTSALRKVTNRRNQKGKGRR